MSIIAVEKGLDDVTKYLIQEGYDVRQYDEAIDGRISSYNKYDVVVLTEKSENVIGVDEETTGVPIVDVEGLTLNEIREKVENFLYKK